MKFFFDHNMSPKIVKALQELEGNHGDTVIHLINKFPKTITDIEYLTALAIEGDWNIITCDKNISRNPHEIKAWKESQLICFFMNKCWIEIGFWQQAWQLIKRWEDIKKTAYKARPGQGFIFTIKGQRFDSIF